MYNVSWREKASKVIIVSSTVSKKIAAKIIISLFVLVFEGTLFYALSMHHFCQRNHCLISKFISSKKNVIDANLPQHFV